MSAIADVSVTVIEVPDPVEFFSSCSGSPRAALLTGNGPGDISRYSLAGIDPHAIFSHDGRVLSAITAAGTTSRDLTPWESIDDIFARYPFHRFGEFAARCGVVGYISYDAYHTIEEVETVTREGYSIPLMECVVYNRYILYDHREAVAYEIIPRYHEPGSVTPGDGERAIPGEPPRVAGLSPECSRDEYCRRVRRIIDYIIEGDVYEVCLSQQFSGSFSGDPYLLFRRLFERNPAPFSAYLDCGRFTAVCNSPELFIRCEGSRVESRPIKGTAPRYRDPGRDTRSREELLASAKDQAELYMIIDLLRNDIGKVCVTGSVTVADPKRLEAYENVYQLIGIVTGELEPGRTYGELLRAVFPGGSITGCPKVRSMEIIEELETWRRNLYTGTIFHGSGEYLTANIVIRTAVITGDQIFINTGGAVTIDSDPEREYEETLHKIRNIAQVAGAADTLGDGFGNDT